MVIKFSEDQIDDALARAEFGLQKYHWLQDNVWKRDVSTDAAFQRAFNGFYRVRRDIGWRKVYFGLMEEGKRSAVGFRYALETLRAATGRIEASYSSKLVATLDPGQPVIDRFVLRNFGLHLPYPEEADRLAKTLQVHSDLCEAYRRLMGSPTGISIIARFRERYPSAQITDLKRVDLVLWQIR